HAPPACVDTEEQRRPATAGHSVHLRPSGANGGGAGCRSHLRNGPAATAVWVPSKGGCQDGSPPSLLACDGAGETGGGGRRSTRLLHFDSAFSSDAVSESPHQRRMRNRSEVDRKSTR